jgi:hypothetical protein
MGKVGLKPKELTRREKHRLWRKDAKMHTLLSEPTSQHPTQFSRAHQRHAKKSGGRRKPIRAPDVLSPSKVKRIKDAHEKKQTGGTSPNISSGMK